MAYQTGTGTMTQLIDQFATFCLANGFSAVNTTLVAKQWWRISCHARDGGAVALKNLVFRDGTGSDVGVPDTIIASSEVGASPKEDAFNSGGWCTSQSATTKFIGGFYNTAVNVRQISVETDETILNASNQQVGNGAEPINYSLEWSDDGVTWTTLYVFNTGGIYTQPGGDTYVIDNTKFPLTCDGTGDLIYNWTYLPAETDESWSSLLDYNPDSTFQTIDTSRYFLNMGRTEVLGSYRVTDPLEGPCGLNNVIPGDDLVAEWHFYADNTVCNYAHCVWRMTHRGEPRWFHVSLGVIDKRGMSHNNIAYCLHSGMSYAAFSNSTNSNRRWQSLRNGNPLFPDFGTGTSVSSYNDFNSSLWYILDTGGSGYAFPQDGAWPNREVTHSSGSFFLGAQWHANSFSAGSGQRFIQSSSNGGWDAHALSADVHPVSGYITLGSGAVVAKAGRNVDDLICYLGEIPDMRSANILSVTDGQEVTQDANTWQLFPRLVKTPLDNMNEIELPSSGDTGWAYRKVV